MNFPNRGLLIFALTLAPSVALAEPGFARPPDAPLVTDSRAPEPYNYPDRPLPRSFVRAYIGPALRLSEQATDGGLYAAFDLGGRATGLRVSGAWMRAGAEKGLSQYSGELWIDFGEGRQLHPVISAGAALARVGVVDASGSASTANVGVGVLRGSLDYVLPIAEDARVGVDVIGNVPAIRSAHASDVRPWLIGVARVGIGF
ncbi:MAG: hypothetical protein ACOY0T_22835 [Myxococcota bacterium]